MANYSLYKRKREPDLFVRVVVEMPKNEVEAVDYWGVNSGMPSRTATIRSLLKKALELSEEENKEAGESQLPGTDSPALHMNPRRNT